MPTYRVYTIGRAGTFLGAPEVAECADDEEVVARAMLATNGFGIEIWDSKRLVAQLRATGRGHSGVVMDKRNRSQDYDRSIRYRNVERYRRLLRTVVDEERRRFLLGLLAKEQQKQKDAGDSKYPY